MNWKVTLPKSNYFITNYLIQGLLFFLGSEIVVLITPRQYPASKLNKNYYIKYHLLGWFYRARI